jgi:integrase
MKPSGPALRPALEARLRLLETTLQPATIRHYRSTARLFLEFLEERYPEVRLPSQLRRDPHLLGWLEFLWKRRTAQGAPLNAATRGQFVMHLRVLLDLLADLPQPPAPHLLWPQDIPPRLYRLPRPLSAEDDARLQQYWRERSDPTSTTLWLQRLTGMRIGECVDLRPDCLRHLGNNHWSLHVPHGKPRSERWVPADDQVRVLIERLSFLRTLPPPAPPDFLLPRPKGRAVLLTSLRRELCHAAVAVGIRTHIVPHQLRHTYATTMLRDGMSLPCLMKLLGHHNANMTLLYVEVTQEDLQREYHAAIQHLRHLPPAPAALRSAASGDLSADAPAVAAALDTALRLVDLYRHRAGSGRPLLLLSRRLTRIRTIFKKLTAGQEDGK